jgi:two-component system sensor histidine kinase RegB
MNSAAKSKASSAVTQTPNTHSVAEPTDQWLVRLRWIAVLGMLATVAVASKVVPTLPLAPLVAIIGAVAASNLMWLLLIRRRRRRSLGQPERFFAAAPMQDEGVASSVEPRPGSFAAAQIVVDLVAVTTVLWFSGGARNPFAVFITFQIVLAGVLCSGRTTIGVAMLAVASTTLLFWAPPLPLDSSALGAEQVRWLASGIALATVSGFIGYFVYVFTRRLEQLRARAAQDEKLAIVGRLVGGMSHELNTPLATILLASRDLATLGHDMAPDEIAQLGATIAEEAQRASEVIGLMRGQLRPDLHREPVELRRFVAELTTKELGRRGYRGRVEVPDGVAIETAVLRAGLTGVLTNLLANAVEALAAEAEPLIRVTVERHGSALAIHVDDNGPGLRRELVGRLGEPFRTTKGDQGGLGLGLYVSSVLASRMDGALRVSPSVLGGTCLTLRWMDRAKSP